MLKLFYRLDATVLINERNIVCITKMDGASTALPASSSVINLYNRTGKIRRVRRYQQFFKPTRVFKKTGPKNQAREILISKFFKFYFVISRTTRPSIFPAIISSKI